MKPVLVIFLAFITTNSFGQIKEADNRKAELLIDNFQNHIDSTSHLTGAAKVYFVSDSLFNAMILTLKNGASSVLDLRYKDNFRGYTAIGGDLKRDVLIKHRGDGSGNPPQLRVINKENGEDKWLGDYPFYMDKKGEIVAYQRYKDTEYQIAIHDFSTGKIETYPAPGPVCLCCECYEMVLFNDESFTIKFVDTEENLTELKVVREQ